MDKQIKPVYFFHIPKTAGRYLYFRIFFILESLLLKDNVQYKDLLHGSRHYLYSKIDDVDMISMTSLRNPVQRTISHWVHMYANVIDPANIKQEKKKLLTFLEENPEDDIIDYQTKLISYVGLDELLNPDDTKLHSVITGEHLDLAKDRLRKTDYLFDANMIDESEVDDTIRSLAAHVGVSLPKNFKLDSVPETSSAGSLLLNESFTADEKRMVEDFMRNDMEIYNTSFR